MDFCVILTTITEKNTATEVAKTLVERKAAACVNIIQNITSIYEWDKEVCEAKKFLLIIKTKTKLFKVVEDIIIEASGYEVPEVIQLDIENGFEKYLNWINKNTLSI